MIAVVDYGAGNLRSVQKALEKLGACAEITGDADVIRRAERVILPGVGAFAAGMAGLERAGLTQAVKRAALAKPFLGICLGMQMLLSGSEEGGETPGLGLIPGWVNRFRVALKIPHVGWNGVEATDNPLFAGIAPGENFYFVHSYFCEPEAEYSAGETEYGRHFCSVVRRGSLFGVQFHPEKSGAAGLKLLDNFLHLEVAA